MLILNKYKSTLYLNFLNATEFKTINRVNKPLNYVYNHRIKFMRSFIYFYAIFLSFMQNSCIVYKSNPEFRLKISFSSLLIIDSDYNDFIITL